jgi:replicative DNA helicase
VNDWAGKLAGHTARIAGLLHLAENLRGGCARPIDADTVTAAVKIADYLVAHALAVFDAIGAARSLGDARALAEWIKRRDGQPFTRRDAHVGNRARFPLATDLDLGLAVLVEHGYIRRRPKPPTTGRGRPLGPAFDINPSFS